MDGACSTHGRICNSYEKPEGRDHLQDLDVNGNIILQWILGK